MATRMGFRYVSRRFLTSGTGKILSEEERATENVFIKKMEQERLEKLARKGPKPEKPDAGSGGSVTDAKPSSSTSTSGAFTEKVSTDRYRNYAVSAGVFTFGCGLGWYLSSKEKNQEVHV
ncbi:hypothetical protein ES288_D05G087100v1 [Gossypium darwinii]|nr:hypothetical protein ES288_D05G087100v1 [Gossypium darwinii]TYH69983.1 hypothetical protein ES332_D05G088300v1 [Gossypium tomentosum]